MVKEAAAFFWILVSCGTPAIPVEAKETPEFAFGVIADVQYAHAAPASNRYYRRSVAKLERCVRDLNSDNLTFTIQLGDMVDRDFASYDEVLSAYRRLRMPAYYVVGNHDARVVQGNGDRLIEKWGIRAPYYDFSYHSWRFIVLDTSSTRIGREKPASRPASASPPDYPALDPRQKAWLKTRLDAAARTGEKVIVFGHIPLFPAHVLPDDAEIIHILEASKCVVAYFGGHHHEGNYAERNGIHYVTLHGMVETADQTAYAVVEVYPDHLRIAGRGREPGRVLTWRNSPASNHEPAAHNSGSPTGLGPNQPAISR